MRLHLVAVLLVASAFCLSCAAAVTHGNSTVPDPLALSFGRQHGSNKRAAAYIHVELLLRQIVAECAKRENTVLQLDSQGQLQVLQKLPADAPCPALDIALRGSERGVGMCTDVALYLLHMGRTGEAGRGARIIPLLPAADMAAYNAKCTQTTARMFLESMYHEWVAPSASGGFHMMQVNSEHMFKVHEPLHKEMDVFLCKTEFCQQLLVQYVTQKGWKAEVWYMGHTSSDVLVLAPDSSSSSSGTGNTQFVSLDSSKDQDSTRQQHQVQSLGSESSVTPVHADYNQFLHVKGKSGLKHTTQLLECWTQHPEFPTLTVIGQTSVKDDIVQKVAMGSVKNVQLLPKPAQDESIAAAVRDMARRLAIAAAAPAAESLTAVAAAATPAPVPAAAAPAVPTPAQPPAGANKAAATAVPGQPAAGPNQPMAQGSAITNSGSSSALSTATAEPAAYPEPVHQFGRRRKPIRQSKQAALQQQQQQQQQQQKQPSTVVRQTAQQQQQQPEKLVTPPAKQKQKEQQQGQPRQPPQTQESNRPRQQAHQPATQFGRRRKQPTQQQQQALPQQQQQQQQQQVAASAAAAAVADSAELQQSKQKVLELFSTIGLNAEPVAATRRLLGRSTAAAIAAMRRLLTSSSSKSSSAATTVADKDKEALRLAGKHLGWIPTAVDKDQLLGFDDIRQFQASSGVQICVSEREGFGHYLNEARAAGALVISTDHPPMNELVQDGVSGVLVTPSRTGSYQEWQALGSYSHINAYVTPSNICAAVQRVLAMPVEQRRQLGLQARQQYLQEKAQFVQKLRVLRKTLHRWRMEGRYKPSGQSSAEDR